MVVQVNDVGMVASELRIGNWVELNGNYFKIFSSLNHLGVDLDSETLDKHMMFAGIDAIKPIPLTEEILLLCGFDLIGECFFISKLPSIFLKKPFIGADYLLIKSNGGDQLTSIRYLHQLQNLYYCLCGEELNIKL